jgi:hypothetical protein
VVGLRDDRAALALEPLDQVDLPQRPGEVERLRHHPPDELAQLRLRPRLRERGVANVPAQVKGRIVGPDRVVDVQAQRRDLLPETRHQVEPLIHVFEQVIERGRLALDDDRPAHVHVDRSALGEQRGHV